MNDYLLTIIIIAGWFLVNRVILPKMGIPT